jgi:hypothetical protein
MSCGCKKKHVVLPEDQPRTVYHVRVTDNGSIEEALVPPPPSPAATIKNIVEKMNEILTPSS